MFIGLNPSTADETNDDPTIRRCVNFAKSWGYGALCMTNLFAFRATKPEVMKQQKDPIGEKNNHYIKKFARGAGVVIAAWGVHGSFWARDHEVKLMLPRLHHLGLTKHGDPRHPLYLKKDLSPVIWTIDTAKGNS